MSEVQVWRYALRNDKPGEGWGVFLLDSNGMLAIASDFGNYVYHWPSQGWGKGGFREFLLELDTCYLSGKLAGGAREYQADRTLSNIREEICRLRREGYLEKDQARCEWDLPREFNNLRRSEDFGNWLEETRLEEAWEWAVYDVPTQLMLFCQRVWPRFRELLQSDLGTVAA